MSQQSIVGSYFK